MNDKHSTNMLYRVWYICGKDEGVQADICVTNETTESQTDRSIERYNQEKAQFTSLQKLAHAICRKRYK